MNDHRPFGGLWMTAGILLLTLHAAAAPQAPPGDAASETPVFLPKDTPAVYNLALDLTPNAKNAAAEATLLFGYQDEANHYRLTLDAHRCDLSKRVGGKLTLLSSNTSETAFEQPFSLLIKRRPLLLTVVVNRRVVAQVFDTAHGQGRLALVPGDGTLEAGRPKVQKCAPIHIADDFMVEVDESVVQSTVEDRTAAIPEADLASLRAWTVVSGAWRLHAVMEDVLQADDPLLLERIAASPSKPDALRSANPFSMQAASPDHGLAVIGYPFWDDYTATVSVNSSGSELGLVFYYRSPQDYFVLRWRALSVREKPQPVELVRVSSRGSEVLASASVPSSIHQWYRLGVRTFGRHVRAYLDGVPLFDAFHDEMVGGKAGLYSRGEPGTHFDDMTIDSTDSFPFDTEALLGEAAAIADTGWRVAAAKDGEASLQAGKADPGPCRIGPVFPSGVVFGASVALGPKKGEKQLTSTLSLHFGDTTRGVVYEYERGAGEARKPIQRLVQWAGDSRRVLEETQAAAWPSAARHIELDLAEPGIARVYLDGCLEMRSRLDEAVSGSFSLDGRNIVGVRVSDISIRAQRAEDRERPAGNIVFADDPYMQHWSAPQGAWVPAGGMTTFWHKGDFFGPFSVAMPVLDGMQLVFCTDRAKPCSDPEAPVETARGYSLSIDLAKRTVHLGRNGKEVGTASLGSAATVQLHRDGKYVWLCAEDKELLTFRDTSPPPGTRMALLTRKEMAAEDFAGFEITRAQIRDDYFDVAPADWRRVGRWEVTNRFTCDPRWSHLAGSSQGGSAMLWSKAGYSGDMTVEFYAGHKMRRTEGWVAPLYYPRVGDINVAICADGENVDSGYAVTLSGWDPTWSETWTQLWRRGKVVEKSDRELVPRNRELYPSQRVITVPWISKGRAIHGAWYYIKLRKIGNRIEYYFDNELVLSYEDPKPLAGRRIALWTYDNSVMFARAKITYTEKSAPALVVGAAAGEQADLTAVERFESGTSGPVNRIVSDSHPGVLFDFEQGLEGWTNIGGESGAFAEHDTSAAAWGRGSLRLTNIDTGGSFGVRVPLEGLRLSGTKLEFEYRLTAAAKVNLYLKLEDACERWYFVCLSGESVSDTANVRIGSIAGVKPGARWRTATFDLGSALAALRPDDPDLRLLDMRIGNFHEGYLAAGMGGNPRGCSFHLDGFRVIRPGAGPVRAALQTATDDGPSVAFTVSRKIAPGQTPESGELSDDGRFSDLTPGTWFVHAWAKDDPQGTVPVATLPVDVAATRQTVKMVSPAPGAAWGGGPVSLSFAPAAGPHLDVGLVRVHVNGRDLDTTAPVLQYSHAKRQLTIDPRWAPAVFADGEAVAFSLHGATTDGAKIEHEWSYTMKRSADRHGPLLLRLLTYPLHNDFTHTLDPCTNAWGRGGADLALDATTGSAGRGCLRGTNIALSGPSGLALYQRPFNAGCFPLLTFDYRIPKEYHLDLVVGLEGMWKNIHLTDVDRAVKPIGKLEDVVADDTWHHAQVDLAAILRSQPVTPRMFDLSTVLLIDREYEGVGPNVTFYLDNLTLVPAVSGALGIPLRWEAADPSGIREFRFRWHARPSVNPTQKLPGELMEHTFYVPQEGDQYFHFQAIDGNGKASTVLHRRFLVDNTPPQWGTPDPAPGTRAAPSRVVIPVNETGSGIDVASIRFHIDGRQLDLESPALTYDMTSGKITWEWEADVAPEPFADGQTVACALDPVRDFAGNTSPRIEWEWQADHGRDKTPPSVPTVSCPSHRVLTFDTYGENEGDWLLRTFDFYTTTVYRMPRTTSPPDYCVRIYDYRRHETLAIARTQPYDLHTYPVISFEYRIPKDADVDWIFQVDGKPYRVRMTPSEAGPDVVGRVSNVLPDSRWHAAWFDLEEMLRGVLPDSRNPQVEMVGLGTFDLEAKTKRTFLFLDNVMICGPGPARPTFALAARDVSGISGYVCHVDREFDTVPATGKPTTSLPALELGPLESGMWYVHCRARDAVGSWSQTTHYPYYVGHAPE